MATRLTLPNDQWIDVKDRLKVCDEEDQLGYAHIGVKPDGSYDLNVRKMQAGTAAIYIVNWAINDDEGKPVRWPVGKATFKERVEVIRNLYGSVLDDITEALQVHIKAIGLEAESKKKETGTEIGLTSPSAS